MIKNKFTQEYPFKTSPKLLFSYISTPGGLQQWFAEKVTMDTDHVFHFWWDEEDHKAHLVTNRMNKCVRFEFLEPYDENYLEFKLTNSELDNSTFLKVTDYSDNENLEDTEAIWIGMIEDLREIVGG